MKKTLLGLVQDILSDLDSDNVNSIGDTIESAQVASILRGCYFEMMGNRNWPHLRKMFTLTSVSSSSKPVYLKLPSDIKEVLSISYSRNDTSGGYNEIRYKHPEDFLRFINQRSLENENTVQITDYSGVKLLIKTDAGPTYWTSFDDVHIVFDSYDSEVESTLMASKSLGYGFINPTWTHEDDFVPDIPVEFFPVLFNEAKSTASFDLKQMPNQKAEQKAAKGRRRMTQRSWSAHELNTYPNYGRNASGKSYGGGTGRKVIYNEPEA